MTKRSGSELKRLAREFLLGNYTTVILGMLAALFFPPVLLAPFSAGVTQQWNMIFITYLAAAIIIEILGQLLTVSVLRMHLQLAQGRQVVFSDLLWTFRNRPDRLIIATVLLYAILFIPVACAGVCIYYFIPEDMLTGATFLAGVLFVLAAVELYFIYMFELIYPLYIEHPEMTVAEGFRTSRELMHGNKKRLFLLQLSFFGWQMLGLCSIGIGFLWIRPYMTQTTVNFYLDLTGGLDRKGIHIDASVDDVGLMP